jgi:hypothetical protein
MLDTIINEQQLQRKLLGCRGFFMFKMNKACNFFENDILEETDQLTQIIYFGKTIKENKSISILIVLTNQPYECPRFSSNSM